MTVDAIPIDPARLQHGTYDHNAEHTINEGDIVRSYSADVIATNGKIRQPFRHEGHLWTCTSMSGRGGIHSAEAYRLIPEKLFSGASISYRDKTATMQASEDARHDPNGFYDRIRVSFKGAANILCGPPSMFVEDTAPGRPAADPGSQQLSLFAP